MKSGKWYFLHIILFTVITGSLTGTGCRTENGIFNENVINTPYSLYFSDKLGAMYNTNNGKAYKIIFPTDGYKARALTTSGKNIIWVKNNLHLSADNGLNFNPTNYTVSTQANWQSLVLDVPSHKRVYLASSAGNNGVEYSTDNGITWQADPSWGSISGVTVQSFAQLKNGKLYAIDNNGPRIFERLSETAVWAEVTMATPMPPGTYYLSHFNNALIAADVTGAGGLFYSNDGGLNWAPYAGLPNNQQILSAAGPLDQVLLAGLDSTGIYRLEGNTFVPANKGLEPFTSVYGIVGKQDIYKNQVIRQYVYIATNKGLFRSEDLGRNWVLMRGGDYRALY